jgi:hypothetical protein
MSARAVGADSEWLARLCDVTVAEVLAAINHVTSKTDLRHDRVVMAKDIQRELRRGRRPRPCRTHCGPDRSGKPHVYAQPLDVKEKIIHRVVERRLRRVVEGLLPEEYVGRTGTSVQRAALGVKNHIKAAGAVAVVDVARCYESIRPGRMLRRLKQVGVGGWELEWVSQFVCRNRDRLPGIGRGLAFAPIMAAAYLLPVFQRIKPLARAIVWVGDDFLAFARSDASAKEIQVAAHEV